MITALSSPSLSTWSCSDYRRENESSMFDITIKSIVWKGATFQVVEEHVTSRGSVQVANLHFFVMLKMLNIQDFQMNNELNVM